METRPLGASGIEATKIALGTWPMGGWMWGGADEDDSIAAIHAALDHGINFLDTAPIYGFGYAEQIVGKAVADRRDRAVIATKCGMVADPHRGEPKFRSTFLGADENGMIPIHIYNGPESIRQEVELSLRRMGIDQIDLLQTHWQDSTTPIAETVGEMTRLKEEGKIRAIGVCNATVEHMEEYRTAGQLDTDQEKYSMLDREMDSEQLPYCRDRNIAFLPYSPLSRGLLTGKFGPDYAFAEGDNRQDSERFSVENRRCVQRMLDQIKPVAEGHGLSLAQLVLAWTAAQPGVTHVLAGARHPGHAEQAAAAGHAELSDDDLRTINEAIEQHSAAMV